MARRKKPKIVYIADPDEQVAVLELDESTDADLGQDDDVVAEAAPIPAVRKGPRRPSLILMVVFAVIALTVTAAFVFIPPDPQRVPQETKPVLPNCLGFHPPIDWGYELHTLECQSGIMREGQTLADLLLTLRLDYKYVIQLMELLAQRQLPHMQAGNSYIVLHAKANPLAPHMFVYEPNGESYVLLNLKGQAAVHQHRKKLIRKEKRVTTITVQSTLAEAMFNRDFGLRLARDMEEALRYKLDLFHLEPGDQFDFLYDESEYEGGYVDIGKVVGLHYRNGLEENFAFWFDDGTLRGYFDQDGRAMKEGFLKAPLEFGRISSPYNPRRPDPVSRSGVIIPHLGTDYAAPEGTPILAVADGVVMEAMFKGNNGNYVKLFHSHEVQTQYLHMSGFAEGIAAGTHVKQGQVIGYVGSTGRSTGPHVCFRYWKNGQQMDHRKERDFGVSLPLSGPSLQRFEIHRDSLMQAFGPV